MEHRWSIRKKFRNDICIYRNGVKVDTGKICDINKEGMAFKADNLFFMKSTKLEIEFCLDDSEDTKNYRIPVLVLHTSKTKVGAMFIFFNKDDLMDISNLANNIQEMAVV